MGGQLCPALMRCCMVPHGAAQCQCSTTQRHTALCSTMPHGRQGLRTARNARSAWNALAARVWRIAAGAGMSCASGMPFARRFLQPVLSFLLLFIGFTVIHIFKCFSIFKCFLVFLNVFIVFCFLLFLLFL